MELRTYDRDFNLKGAIDDYETLIIHRKLFATGIVQVTVPINAKNSEKISIGDIVTLPLYGNKTGIIRSLETSGFNKIIFKGQTLDGLLGQRLVVPDPGLEYDRIKDVSVEEVLRYYVNRHAVNPTYTKRKIPNLIMATYQARGGPGKWQSKFKNLAEVLENIGTFYRMGYEIIFDPTEKVFIFDVIPKRNTLVKFSTEFDNLSGQTYKKSLDAYASSLYAQGSSFTMTTIAGEDYEGLDRFESFTEITDAADLPELKELAEVELADHKPAESVTADFVPNKTFIYERDFDLGDMVTVVNSVGHIATTMQITEIVETWDRGGHTIKPLFGDQDLTIGRYIKKLQQKGEM